MDKTRLYLAFMIGLAAALVSAAMLKRTGVPIRLPEGAPARALAAPLENAAAPVRPAISAYAAGGGYSIEWNTLDAGGGESAGGGYVLSYTIAQPDAGTRSGGDFTLEGGFWPGLAQPWQNYLPALQR